MSDTAADLASAIEQGVAAPKSVSTESGSVSQLNPTQLIKVFLDRAVETARKNIDAILSRFPNMSPRHRHYHSYYEWHQKKNPASKRDRETRRWSCYGRARK